MQTLRGQLKKAPSRLTYFRQLPFFPFPYAVFLRRITGTASSGKMQYPLKIIIASAGAMFFIVLFGFVVFPKIITSKVKGMVNLKPGSEIRDMFLKVPFPLEFRVYVFSVLNPMDVQGGAIPNLQEIGPFCYEEWKTKINVQDNEGDDTISYNAVDTFQPASWPGCLTGEEEVTVPHPMILGMVNTVVRMKPGAISLANKAIKSIYENPPSIFITVKAKDLLFDGVVIHCGVKDFAGKAICTTLKAEPSLRQINEDDIAFSLFGPKNGTPSKTIVALRGVQESRSVGKIVTYDGEKKQGVWNGTKCNQILGTDGTIFPPFLKKEEGLMSFSPDLCRSLGAVYEKKAKYEGIPVSAYYASLGDQSKNADERCFCTTPETCMKKGLMDLFKCSGVPIYASLPHFYDSHDSYLKGVKGLQPNKEKHGIRILFESTTGSPVYAKKRLMFSMPLEPNPKVDLFTNFTETIFPLFWVEEGVELNNTYTKPLKDLFKIKKIVKVVKYLVLLGSLAGMGAGAYLHFTQTAQTSLEPVRKVKPAPDTKSPISTVYNGNSLEAANGNLSEKTLISQVSTMLIRMGIPPVRFDNHNALFNIKVEIFLSPNVTMKIPLTVIVASGVILFVSVLMKLFVFDAVMRTAIRAQTCLKLGSEIRGIYLKIPFPLDFKIYFFNVTNTIGVQNGSVPILKEIGPYWYNEYVEKVDVIDDEAEDSLTYSPAFRYEFNQEKSGSLSQDDYVTILHPLIVGMVNQVKRDFAAFLPLVNKTISDIFREPKSIYLTAKVRDILFDGIEINCNVKDFASTTVCSQIKQVPGIKTKKGEEKIYLFSLFGSKNGTSSKRFKILRGITRSRDLGRLLEVDGQKEIKLWKNNRCNRFNGTDGWIFPPMLSAEEGLWAYSTDLCRNVEAKYVRDLHYKGLAVRSYEADLGDAEHREEDRCYCPKPEQCSKKGVIDLSKCLGSPIIATLPHFLDTYEEYLDQVKGLKPDPEKHKLQIIFEPMTGTPVEAAKRIQLNMFVEPNDQIDLMNSVPMTLHPIFWMDESAVVEGDLLKKLQNIFLMTRAVSWVLWLVMALSAIVFGVTFYQHKKNRSRFKVTMVHEFGGGNQTKDTNVLTRRGIDEKAGVDNNAMRDNEFDKY
ncbi:uncharacterized protein LOC132705124 [Cylas formicarius]|uniref:uncharacterized protein LOC132705124 n=1 Tax=Cylas formicarius TaxID=197179 RepID=UPI002958CE0F|nr:uncharacterized protein LOC132705124 [Cylas formicarius]